VSLCQFPNELVVRYSYSNQVGSRIKARVEKWLSLKDESHWTGEEVFQEGSRNKDLAPLVNLVDLRDTDGHGLATVTTFDFVDGRNGRVVLGVAGYPIDSVGGSSNESPGGDYACTLLGNKGEIN